MGVSTSVFGGVLDDAQIDALLGSPVAALEIIGLRDDSIFISHLRDRLRGAHFRLNSVHLPFGQYRDVSQTDDRARIQALEETTVWLRLAAALGAPLAVIHPSAEPVADGERAARLDTARRSLEQLARSAERFGIRLAVECLPRSCLGNTARELAAILDGLDPRYVGACIDINHLNLREPDVAAAVAMLAPRLLTLHCSDNDGVDERHWLPGSPGGVIDWPAFLGALRAASYGGPFMYEVRTLGTDPAEALRQIHANYQEVIVPAAARNQATGEGD